MNRKGFTLLEILLVIAAIGILAAIVIVAINPNRQLEQARQASRESDQRTIRQALEQYLIDNGEYPADISTDFGEVCNTGSQTPTTATTDCTGYVDLRSLVPTYVASIPTQTENTGTGYWAGQTTASNTNVISLESLESQGDSTQIITHNGETYIVHQYTQVGVDSFERPSGVSTVDVLVVAGGGSGGTRDAGGGGAGGLIYNTDYDVSSDTMITVEVGDGGAPISGQGDGNNGENSQFGTLVAIGGGGGGDSGSVGRSGGSGGGNGGNNTGNTVGGSATPGQGNSGGVNTFGSFAGGGGGGAGSSGENVSANEQGGDGGEGLQIDITGTPVWYAAGGGGGGAIVSGQGGSGIGGDAARGSGIGEDGQENTGSGGGAHRNISYTSGAGGSGIVIIRYPLNQLAL